MFLRLFAGLRLGLILILGGIVMIRVGGYFCGFMVLFGVLCLDLFWVGLGFCLLDCVVLRLCVFCCFVVLYLVLLCFLLE